VLAPCTRAAGESRLTTVERVHARRLAQERVELRQLEERRLREALSSGDRLGLFAQRRDVLRVRRQRVQCVRECLAPVVSARAGAGGTARTSDDVWIAAKLSASRRMTRLRAAPRTGSFFVCSTIQLKMSIWPPASASWYKARGRQTDREFRALFGDERTALLDGRHHEVRRLADARRDRAHVRRNEPSRASTCRHICHISTGMARTASGTWGTSRAAGARR
jgi:hypothetical protein